MQMQTNIDGLGASRRVAALGLVDGGPSKGDGIVCPPVMYIETYLNFMVVLLILEAAISDLQPPPTPDPLVARAQWLALRRAATRSERVQPQDL
eukprot:scaffold205446_cov45-Tisochrysis_lutea.AAC.1